MRLTPESTGRRLRGASALLRPRAVKQIPNARPRTVVVLSAPCTPGNWTNSSPTGPYFFATARCITSRKTVSSVMLSELAFASSSPPSPTSSELYLTVSSTAPAPSHITPSPPSVAPVASGTASTPRHRCVECQSRRPRAIRGLPAGSRHTVDHRAKSHSPAPAARKDPRVLPPASRARRCPALHTGPANVGTRNSPSQGMHARHTPQLSADPPDPTPFPRHSGTLCGLDTAQQAAERRTPPPQSRRLADIACFRVLRRR
eukprot:3148710-Rhodomonas_salina.2